MTTQCFFLLCKNALLWAVLCSVWKREIHTRVWLPLEAQLVCFWHPFFTKMGFLECRQAVATTHRYRWMNIQSSRICTWVSVWSWVVFGIFQAQPRLFLTKSGAYLRALRIRSYWDVSFGIQAGRTTRYWRASRTGTPRWRLTCRSTRRRSTRATTTLCWRGGNWRRLAPTWCVFTAPWVQMKYSVMYTLLSTPAQVMCSVHQHWAWADGVGRLDDALPLRRENK